ncbi:ABC-ATPase UvrA, partial [Dissulfurirhabdus thermomarina]|uniref:ABC-ATPase UvrA n=1 Tax=Dissulfurirhabdus thermomarina TaxID=1765737 RepID=UPI001C65B193
AGGRNPRSTVATLAGLAGLIRALFAAAGRARCPGCGTEIRALGALQVADRLAGLPEGTRLLVLAPMGDRGPGTPAGQVLGDLQKDGFSRVRVSGRVVRVEDLLEDPAGAVPAGADLEAVVDRVVLRPGLFNRLADSLALAFRLGGGRLRVAVEPPGGPPEEHAFSEDARCPGCGAAFPPLTPALFAAGGEGEKAGLPLPLARYVRHVTLGPWTYPEVMAWPLATAGERLAELRARLGTSSPADLPIRPALRLVDELLERVASLVEAGLGHLGLDRPAPTLAAGELQRLRLAGALGRRLTGVLYILDEPTAGLHPADHPGLQRMLARLAADGNTVLVVEHDLDLLREVHHLVELGPGAGPDGGRLLYAGPPGGLKDAPQSVTAPYLLGKSRLRRLRRNAPRGRIRLRRAEARNLAGIDVEIPLGALVCITGVSGAGKSALVEEELRPRLSAWLRGEGGGVEIEGGPAPERLLAVDQRPLGGGALSTPASVIGVFTPLRHLFARTPEARRRGYGPGYFSLNRKGGRCERCRGRGRLALELGALPPLPYPCDLCHGRRYNRDALEIRYRGLTMADVLDLTAGQAADFFRRIPPVRAPLEAMERLGLGYLPIGQPVPTLSGGEAQRLRLAVELAREAARPTLFVFDEPTRGLHQVDIQRLLDVFDDLLDRGHTLVLVEQAPEVLALADWVIELGPGPGPAGGRLGAARPPASVAGAGGPTGPHLARALEAVDTAR